jgi:hypothetical protein
MIQTDFEIFGKQKVSFCVKKIIGQCEKKPKKKCAASAHTVSADFYTKCVCFLHI